MNPISYDDLQLLYAAKLNAAALETKAALRRLDQSADLPSGPSSRALVLNAMRQSSQPLTIRGINEVVGAGCPKTIRRAVDSLIRMGKVVPGPVVTGGRSGGHPVPTYTPVEASHV